jgi:predicted DNA-binding transcriptional regulator YafY
MSINERLYRIEQLLNDKRSVNFKELQEKLEVSAATLKRDLAYMRDCLHVPIIFDRELGGYRYESDSSSNHHPLPGLWFTAEEIHALLTMQHLLSNLDTGGLLGPHIKPLQSRLLVMLDEESSSIDEVTKRIKIETIGSRKFNLIHFQSLSSALINRKMLNIEYYARGTNELSSREISPQRIIYYRDNWYLDAWCHVRNGLRSFSIDAINKAEILEKKSEDIHEEILDAELGSGYGIFAGKNVHWATIRFNSTRARWVATEKWHPEQVGVYLDNGDYELKIPFSDTRELSMDILKHGAEVKVIEPPALVTAIRESLNQMRALYA